MLLFGGDGVCRMLNEEDFRILLNKTLEQAPEILKQGLPNMAGFATGMTLAFWFL